MLFGRRVTSIPDTLTAMLNALRRPRSAAIAAATAVMLTLAPPLPAADAAMGVAAESAQDRSRTEAAGYPLQNRSLAHQLSARSRTRLPMAKRWAHRVLAAVMDQPGGLTEVQNVSALHIRRVFRNRLGGEAAKSGLRIAWRESRLLPNVVNTSNPNRTNDWGLFQLNDGGTLQHAGGTPGAAALRPKWNVRAAARLIADVGWWPWGGRLG